MPRSNPWGRVNLEEITLPGEGQTASSLLRLTVLPYPTQLDLHYLSMSQMEAQTLQEACPLWGECLVLAASAE